MMRILADRRGVVLLLVLATVALFTAMVITFSADRPRHGARV
jgi:type II secretory pathway component PulK